MSRPHLFEFCDQDWVPSSARECLFELMEYCNSGFRSFYDRVAEASIEIGNKRDLETIVEVGAGLAPITARLAAAQRTGKHKLVPCDLVPNRLAFEALERRYGERVKPVYAPVDIREPQATSDKTLWVLSAIFHHVPFSQRRAVLRSMCESAAYVAVFEPLRLTPLSICLTTLSVVPALWLPIAYRHRPGSRRRFFWCWLVPVVAPMFLWDGVVSCWRQWSDREWRQALAELSENLRDVDIQRGWHSYSVVWKSRQSSAGALSASDSGSSDT